MTRLNFMSSNAIFIVLQDRQTWLGGQPKNPCHRKNWQNPPLSGEAGPPPPEEVMAMN